MKVIVPLGKYPPSRSADFLEGRSHQRRRRSRGRGQRRSSHGHGHRLGRGVDRAVAGVPSVARAPGIDAVDRPRRGQRITIRRRIHTVAGDRGRLRVHDSARRRGQREGDRAGRGAPTLKVRLIVQRDRRRPQRHRRWLRRRHQRWTGQARIGKNAGLRFGKQQSRHNEPSRPNDHCPPSARNAARGRRNPLKFASLPLSYLPDSSTAQSQWSETGSSPFTSSVPKRGSAIMRCGAMGLPVPQFHWPWRPAR